MSFEGFLNEMTLLKKKKIGFINLTRKKKARILEIDFLRGLCILLMVMDHFFFDFGYLIYDLFDITLLTAPDWIISLTEASRFYWDWNVDTAGEGICYYGN